MNHNEYMEEGNPVLDNDEFTWWVDKNSTHYAQKENLQGVSLKNIIAYIVLDKKNEVYSRLLVDNEAKSPVYESSSLEGIGSHIDIMKAIKLFNI